MSIKVMLTPSEIMSGAIVGVMRQVQNINKGRVPAHGSGNENDWQLHIEGALGEMAVAKALGIYWSGSLGNLSHPDVGLLQVRTRSKHGWSLILHKEDNDDDIFVLAAGVNGSYTLDGWIYARDGKVEKNWKDLSKKNRWAYFVDKKELNDISELVTKENCNGANSNGSMGYGREQSNMDDKEDARKLTTHSEFRPAQLGDLG